MDSKWNNSNSKLFLIFKLFQIYVYRCQSYVSVVSTLALRFVLAFSSLFIYSFLFISLKDSAVFCFCCDKQCIDLWVELTNFHSRLMWIVQLLNWLSKTRWTNKMDDDLLQVDSHQKWHLTSEKCPAANTHAENWNNRVSVLWLMKNFFLWKFWLLIWSKTPQCVIVP